MYVCHCEVVSDHTIRTAISAGARDVQDVAASCGAGSACGGCHPTIEDLLDDAMVAIHEPEVLRARHAFRRHERSRPAVPTHAVAS